MRRSAAETPPKLVVLPEYHASLNVGTTVKDPLHAAGLTLNYSTTSKNLLLRVRPTSATVYNDYVLPPLYNYLVKPIATNADALTPDALGVLTANYHTVLQSLILHVRPTLAESTRLVVPPEFHVSVNLSATVATPLGGAGMTVNYDNTSKFLLFRVRPTDATDYADLVVPPPYLLPMRPVGIADALTTPATVGHVALHSNTSLRTLVLLSRHSTTDTTRLVVPPEYHVSVNVGTVLTPLCGPGMTVNYNAAGTSLLFRVRPTDATDVVDVPVPASNTLLAKWIGAIGDATLPGTAGIVTVGYHTTLQSLVLRTRHSATEYGPERTGRGGVRRAVGWWSRRSSTPPSTAPRRCSRRSVGPA